jgi:cobalt-zinc-cadmium efflux system outer membrane protein
MKRLRWACWALLGSTLAATGVAAEPPAAVPQPAVLTRQDAVRFALANNPQLALVREQRGLAAAGVVLARVYPYNPVFTSVVLGVNGEGVTNRVFNEHVVAMQLELCGQGKYRRAAAAAAVTRTEWEVAAQEVATAISVLRAYDTVLYREQKLRVLEETVRLSEQLVELGKRGVELQRSRPADVILARTEMDTARAQLGQGRTALAVARAELRRLIGTLDDCFAVGGDLDLALPTLVCDALVPYALQLRPEVHARSAAIAEAEARLGLQVADRLGNPSIGPRVEVNETSDTFVGVVMTGPIPVLNRRQGEIAQRRADVARAQVDLHSTEQQVALAVSAAMARLTEARRWADYYQAEALPNLRKARQELEQFLADGEPGVDVVKVLGAQRNFLQVTNAYLDARYEVSQAQADLAAAVGDPALAAGCYPAGEPTPPAP